MEKGIRVRVSCKGDGFVFAVDPRDQAALGEGACKKAFLGYSKGVGMEFLESNERVLIPIAHLMMGFENGRFLPLDGVVFIRADNGEAIVRFQGVRPRSRGSIRGDDG